MRLINVEKFLKDEVSVLEVFAGPLPKYVILSHTWGDEEVTIQDMSSKSAAKMKGYSKIRKTCELAHTINIPYAWIDTCCIDKTSSAELSEAINSMYRWYAQAELAYAFLVDWKPHVIQELPERENSSATPNVDEEDLSKCRWFTRGWTLQELIAPEELDFYDSSWNYRGTRVDMAEVLASITGIDKAVLYNAKRLTATPVARRMSWAAGRRTTREEDRAYSLLGIFNINMPMLYGEGEKAFVRLQETILSETNDMSLFAWKSVPTPNLSYRGIFAHSPTEFSDCGMLSSISAPGFGEDFALTNKGVRINTDLAETGTVLRLNCFVEHSGTFKEVGIYLKKTDSGVYVRYIPSLLAIDRENKWDYRRPTQIYVNKDLSDETSELLFEKHMVGLVISIPQALDLEGFKPVYIEPRSRWDDASRQFLVHGPAPFVGVIAFAATSSAGKDCAGTMFWLVCGANDGSQQPWYTLASAETSPGILSFFTDLHLLVELINERDCQKIILRSRKISAGVKFIVSLTVKHDTSQYNVAYDSAYIAIEGQVILSTYMADVNVMLAAPRNAKIRANPKGFAGIDSENDRVSGEETNSLIPAATLRREKEGLLHRLKRRTGDVLTSTL